MGAFNPKSEGLKVEPFSFGIRGDRGCNRAREQFQRDEGAIFADALELPGKVCIKGTKLWTWSKKSSKVRSPKWNQRRRCLQGSKHEMQRKVQNWARTWCGPGKFSERNLYLALAFSWVEGKLKMTGVCARLQRAQ